MSKINDILGFKENEAFRIEEVDGLLYRIKGNNVEANCGEGWNVIDGTSILIDLVNGDLIVSKNSDWVSSSEVPGSSYYYIDSDNCVEESFEEQTEYDEELARVYNKFRSKEKAEKIAFRQLLYRKLQKLSDENNPSGLDLLCTDTEKYHIYYDLEEKDWRVGLSRFYLRGDVLFLDSTTAEKAITTFSKELNQLVEKEDR